MKVKGWVMGSGMAPAENGLIAVTNRGIGSLTTLVLAARAIFVDGRDRDGPASTVFARSRPLALGEGPGLGALDPHLLSDVVFGPAGAFDLE